MNLETKGDKSGRIEEFNWNDSVFVLEIRQQMLQFAQLQLSDAHLAEDAVQDALIGAMKNSSSFAGRSAFKTWVFAILKNKIADILRKKHRSVEVSSLMASDEEQEDFSMLFNEKGHWNVEDRPVDMGDPEVFYRDKQFWIVFDTCLNNLPAHQAKIFMMREFIGLETDEICAGESLSISNLHVMLHRARLRLQKCLELRWLEGDTNA
jgi:RNA polymerase sigma-70 factor (ECF subfamily)